MVPGAMDVMSHAARALAGGQPPPVIYADRGYPRGVAWDDLVYEPPLPHVPVRPILCTKYCTAAYWISSTAARRLCCLLGSQGPTGWMPSDDFMSVAAGVHRGLR